MPEDNKTAEINLLYTENAKVAAIFWEWRHVANGRSNSVSVIDTGTNEKVRDIAVGELSWGVVIR